MTNQHTTQTQDVHKLTKGSSLFPRGAHRRCSEANLSPLHELAEVSIPASRSKPRLARSYTKISTNTARPPLMENLVFEPFSAPHLPLKWPLRPQGGRCTARRHKLQVSRIRHGYFFSSSYSTTDFRSWLFPPTAASTTYFLPLPLPLPLLTVRSRSAHFNASSCAG